MTTIERIRVEIKELFKASGVSNSSLCFAVLQLFDKYAEQEPMKESLNGVFLKLFELGIQDIVCAEEVYRLIHITYEIGFNTGFNEAKAEQEPTSRVKNELKVELNELEPCNDAVSRQAVDDYIVKLLSGYLYEEERERLEKLNAYLWELPSVRPQEPKTDWIPVSERLPEDTYPVNITWVNHDPESYYADIKDKPFTATGHYCNGRWWWYSVTCQDYLDEYGHWDIDAIDDAIEVIAWMPLPKPYEPQESE